jgi:hypothetical protein
MNRLCTTDHEREVTRRCNDRKITGDELELIGLVIDYRRAMQAENMNASACMQLMRAMFDSACVVELDNEARQARISGELSDEQAERGCRPSEAAE